MILRALTVCCGLIFAGSAVADTCDEREVVERIPASEAFQRSEGQIVFMDAGDLLFSDVFSVCRFLSDFRERRAVPFEIVEVQHTGDEGRSFLCYNAEACYPVSEDNLTTSLASVDEFTVEHGLVTR